MKDLLVVIGAVVLMVFGACMMRGAPPAYCEGWSCVGSCGGPGSCPGHGCVCVGYTSGAGRCVSE